MIKNNQFLINQFLHMSCPICFSSLKGVARSLPCGHMFCTLCIDEWLSKKCSCPMCRDNPVLSMLKKWKTCYFDLGALDWNISRRHDLMHGAAASGVEAELVSTPSVLITREVNPWGVDPHGEWYRNQEYFILHLPFDVPWCCAGDPATRKMRRAPRCVDESCCCRTWVSKVFIFDGPSIQNRHITYYPGDSFLAEGAAVVVKGLLEFGDTFFMDPPRKQSPAPFKLAPPTFSV